MNTDEHEEENLFLHDKRGKKRKFWKKATGAFLFS